MTKLTDAQLSDLRGRCIKAAARGYVIGQVDQYLNDLAEETGVTETPANVKKGSAEHLRYMVEEAQLVRSGKKTKKVKPAPVKPAPAPVKPPPAVEKTAKKKTKKPYEDWSFEELYKESQVRDISGRSTMSKDELVAAMYKADAAD